METDVDNSVIQPAVIFCAASFSASLSVFRLLAHATVITISRTAPARRNSPSLSFSLSEKVIIVGIFFSRNTKCRAGNPPFGERVI